MEIELVQLECKDGDLEYNLNKVRRAIKNSSDATDIMVFPETYLSGFPTQENLNMVSQSLDGSGIQQLKSLSKEKNIAITVGMAEAHEGKFYNTTVFITPEDGLLAYYRKTHLWLTDHGIFDAGDRYSCIEWRGVKIGFLICFDIEYPESARALGELGTELLIVTNGNMDPYGLTHRTAIMARAQENHMFAVMTNRVGLGNDGLVFHGGSCVVNPMGQLLCEAGREECSIRMNIDPKQMTQFLTEFNYLKERRMKITGQKIQHHTKHSDWIIS
ncbi:carbon-nitrogen hydrolase family protein [Commensalibacter papalotli (ex Botero et al. 2024)]|uniref:Hydrolyzes alpha-ketoglutaramate (Nit2) (PUBMED:28373563) n=1 Tax=Commensalibacter papalotli (ex Botero et al. 2024) TaxID=2972766 RepID=A0ABM9HSX6_9PROT|nr:carbon-nitrogen hydrolase family protein [Commensalibacter papalotli (ex Botero et al. 2024)]CAI3952906.1 Omega-amidase YafV/Nit2 [Commensalibacter papalotli (ex Botero et al. 2024)]CAI3953427.1 Omega-amidase YafV/Nit2 [Commensalibacter papalotli (ex Botero et al. 2024)]